MPALPFPATQKADQLIITKDSLIGKKGNIVFDALGGNDYISIRADGIKLGEDDTLTITGGAGNDTIDFYYLSEKPNDFIDLLGGDGNDTIYAQSYDVLLGNSGDYMGGLFVFGGPGNDYLQVFSKFSTYLNGDEGNDTLVSGEGRELMVGGTGKDRFVFQNQSAAKYSDLPDNIFDFESGADKIVLSGFDANTKKAGTQKFTFVSEFTGAGGEVKVALAYANQPNIGI